MQSHSSYMSGQRDSKITKTPENPNAFPITTVADDVYPRLTPTDEREIYVPITTGIELRPFNIPNFANVATPPGKRQDGFKPADGIALKYLDQTALDALVNQWVEDVYVKAEKQRPASCA